MRDFTNDITWIEITMLIVSLLISKRHISESYDKINLERISSFSMPNENKFWPYPSPIPSFALDWF